MLIWHKLLVPDDKFITAWDSCPKEISHATKNFVLCKPMSWNLFNTKLFFYGIKLKDINAVQCARKSWNSIALLCGIQHKEMQMQIDVVMAGQNSGAKDIWERSERKSAVEFGTDWQMRKSYQKINSPTPQYSQSKQEGVSTVWLEMLDIPIVGSDKANKLSSEEKETFKHNADIK